MKIGITQKLFLAMLMASILAVASLVITMQWQLKRGFLQYINSIEQAGVSRLASKLESGYAAGQSWDFLNRDPSLWRRYVAESMHMQPPEGMLVEPPDAFPHGPPPDPLHEGPSHEPFPGSNGPPPSSLPPHMARHFDQRLFILDADRHVIISRTESPDASAAIGLRHENRIAGYLGILPRSTVSDPLQQRFLQEQKNAFVIVSVVVLLLSAGLSLLLAGRLIKPVRALARATHQLAAGDHAVRVAVESSDELGLLAEDFNSLAITLGKNDQARRQWVADISHELRTPLAILRGEIEALQDGVREPSQKAVASLHGEVLRLGRLVEDLYQLSLYDLCAMSYKKTDLDGSAVLAEAVESFRAEFTARGILLKAEIPPGSSRCVFADRERLHQLFDNLLENSLRYTDSGGKLVVRLEYGQDTAVIYFDDSAPGVPDESMDRLFDRLYRVESSRNRALGGAGLGLSICRNIVEAHGGSIEAKPSSLDGLCIKVVLPLSERAA